MNSDVQPTTAATIPTKTDKVRGPLTAAPAADLDSNYNQSHEPKAILALTRPLIRLVRSRWRPKSNPGQLLQPGIPNPFHRGRSVRHLHRLTQLRRHAIRPVQNVGWNDARPVLADTHGPQFQFEYELDLDTRARA